MVNDTTFISFTKSNVDYLSKEAFNLFSDAYLKYASESEVEYRNPGCFTANYYDYRGRRTKRVTVTLGVECIQIMSFITDKTVRYRYWKLYLLMVELLMNLCVKLKNLRSLELRILSVL